MKRILQLLGVLALGATTGAAGGVASGLLWTALAHTSNFEGYAAMLVFFGFAPLGALVGMALGVALFARRIRRPPPGM